MQLGTNWTVLPVDTHWVTLLESQPHPGPAGTPLSGLGLLPSNPSSEAIAAYRWPPQDGLFAMENVRSLIAKWLASVIRFGIYERVVHLKQAYLCLAPQPGTFCQPSILPPSMAACCAWTVCNTLGTMSGLTVGVTTAPLESVTLAGIPPSGHRPGWSLHQ